MGLDREVLPCLMGALCSFFPWQVSLIPELLAGHPQLHWTLDILPVMLGVGTIVLSSYDVGMGEL